MLRVERLQLHVLQGTAGLHSFLCKMLEQLFAIHLLYHVRIGINIGPPLEYQ